MALFYYIFVPLALTIAVEVFVSFVLGKRGIDGFLAVVAANLATNPAMNFILYLVRLYVPAPNTGLAVIFLELVVVAVEWRIFAYLFNDDEKKTFLYSLILNASSYVFGLIFL